MIQMNLQLGNIATWHSHPFLVAHDHSFQNLLFSFFWIFQTHCFFCIEIVFNNWQFQKLKLQFSEPIILRLPLASILFSELLFFATFFFWPLIFSGLLIFGTDDKSERYCYLSVTYLNSAQKTGRENCSQFFPTPNICQVLILGQILSSYMVMEKIKNPKDLIFGQGTRPI